MKIGILGFAHGHVNMYCARWRERPEMGITVAAGWDHDAARAAKAAADFGFRPAASTKELLAAPDIPAVLIAAETSLHAELVEQAAAAGKAIVLQKPLALTMEEADRIVAAVDRSGVPFTLAWQMRVDPQNIRMKELIRSGELGRIFMIRRRHCLSTHLWAGFDNSWHVNPKLNRDIWADDAAHAVDFLYWLFGMPATVTAEFASLLNPKIPNDNGIAIFRYPDGMLAEVNCAFAAAASENTTEITGEKGVVIQNYGDGTSAGVPRPKGAVGLKWFLKGASQWTESGVPEVASHGERLYGLTGPIADFLHGRRPPIATAAEGRDVLRMILATYEANDRGARVRVGG